MRKKKPTRSCSILLFFILHSSFFIQVGKPANPPSNTSPPTRIIVIGPNSAEIICGLGACEAIIGVDKFIVFPPELKNKTKVGGLFDPDLEKITALQPDLVVLRGHNEALEKLCKDRGIRLYFDKTERIADIETCIRDLGRILGREDKANVMVDAFRASLDSIRKRTKELPKKRILLTVSRQSGEIANILTTGKGTFLNEMIEIAGGVNIFGNVDMPYPQVSAESIIAHRPEVIIELMPEAKLDDERRKQLIEEWRNLGIKAEVGFILQDHALIPSPRFVEVIEMVQRILHGGLASE